jgi:uncharacterized membrane protein YfcA
MIGVLVLSFFQNVSFSIVSRSRNRSSLAYHAVAASASNLIWFWTMKELIAHEMSASLAVPYVIGTVLGSLVGVKISMLIENAIGAESDSHIKRGDRA